MIADAIIKDGGLLIPNIDFADLRKGEMLSGQMRWQFSARTASSPAGISMRAFQKRPRPFPKKEIPDSNKKPPFFYPEIA